MLVSLTKTKLYTDNSFTIVEYKGVDPYCTKRPSHAKFVVEENPHIYMLLNMTIIDAIKYDKAEGRGWGYMNDNTLPAGVHFSWVRRRELESHTPVFSRTFFILFYTMATENKKALVYSILEFLKKSCDDGTIGQDDVEGIEGAVLHTPFDKRDTERDVLLQQKWPCNALVKPSVSILAILLSKKHTAQSLPTY